MRDLVTRILADAGALLSDAKQIRLRRDAFAAGRRLLPRALSGDAVERLSEAADSLGLAEPVVSRLLGFGWQQADGLAELARIPTSRRSEFAHLGALFNLGIVLFDVISDEFPIRARTLTKIVNAHLLQSQLAGEQMPAETSGDVAVDALVALITEFFARCRAFVDDAEQQRLFAGLIQRMYGAETYVTGTRRDETFPTRRVWRELQRKSTLPMVTVARLALFAHPDAEVDRQRAVLTLGRLAGDVLWIIDDLADVREDWESGAWSRVLWLLARRSQVRPRDADEALRLIVDTGIAEAEAQRLATRILRLREIGDAFGSTFARSIQAAVQAWLESLPE